MVLIAWQTWTVQYLAPTCLHATFVYLLLVNAWFWGAAEGQNYHQSISRFPAAFWAWSSIPHLPISPRQDGHLCLQFRVAEVFSADCVPVKTSTKAKEQCSCSVVVHLECWLWGSMWELHTSWIRKAAREPSVRADYLVMWCSICALDIDVTIVSLTTWRHLQVFPDEISVHSFELVIV